MSKKKLPKQVLPRRTGSSNYVPQQIQPRTSYRRYCNGAIGAPITFLDHHNASQFEIIGLAAGNIKGLAGIESKTGKNGPYIGGKLKYGRVFIRKVL